MTPNRQLPSPKAPDRFGPLHPAETRRRAPVDIYKNRPPTQYVHRHITLHKYEVLKLWEYKHLLLHRPGVLALAHRTSYADACSCRSVPHNVRAKARLNNALAAATLTMSHAHVSKSSRPARRLQPQLEIPKRLYNHIITKGRQSDW